jgi:hypothetical protein
MTFYDDKAATINALVAAVTAIEVELGVVPAGVYADVRTRLDILEARINNPFAPAPDVLNPFFIGNTGVTIQAGFGDPNAVLAIPPPKPGSLFLREDGYNDQGLYSFRPDGYWHQIDTDPFTANCDLAGSIYCQTVVGIQGRPVNPAAPQTDTEGDGYVLTWNNTLGWWEPQIGFFAAGDLSGNKISQTVVNLQGNKISVGSPTDAYVLTWNGVALQWEPQAPAIIFDPKDTPSATNIRGNRLTTQSPIDNTKVGVVNLGSRSIGSTFGVIANYGAILSGDQNQVSGQAAVVVGGALNTAVGAASFVGSGHSNTTATANSVVVSGFTNIVSSGSGDSFMGTGTNNTISGGQYNTVLNGQLNSNTGTYADIFNGASNIIDGTGAYATILGGNSHTIHTGAIAGFNLIGQGVNNVISAGVVNGTIINGESNIISVGTGAFISGLSNTSSSDYTMIQGENNVITTLAKFGGIWGDFNTIGDGSSNSHYTSVWGCSNNLFDGYIAMFGLKNQMNPGSTFADIHGDNNTVASPYTGIWGSHNIIGTGGGYVTIFGNANTVNNNSPYSGVFGISNTIGTGSSYAYIWGASNIIANNSANAYAVGIGNTIAGPYNSAWGSSNNITQSVSGYSSAWGSNNVVVGNWTNVWGYLNSIGSAGHPSNLSAAWGQSNTIFGNTSGAYGLNNVVGTVASPVNNANAFGQYGNARVSGQFVQSANSPNLIAGAEQFSRIILDDGGTGGSGANINMVVGGTATQLTFPTSENGKAYDMTIRILVTQTTGTPGTCASFVFDVLAHVESGTLVLDSVNNTFVNPNGTGWSATLSVTSSNVLAVNIPAFGSFGRRAVATVEWRELSRM